MSGWDTAILLLTMTWVGLHGLLGLLAGVAKSLLVIFLFLLMVRTFCEALRGSAQREPR